MKAKTAAMPADPTGPLFNGFSALDCRTSRVHFAGVIGGGGAAVLLLHGYPQSHVTWHQVGPVLADSPSSLPTCRDTATAGCSTPGPGTSEASVGKRPDARS
jgi:hypothetical protein